MSQLALIAGPFIEENLESTTGYLNSTGYEVTNRNLCRTHENWHRDSMVEIYPYVPVADHKVERDELCSTFRQASKTEKPHITFGNGQPRIDQRTAQMRRDTEERRATYAEARGPKRLTFEELNIKAAEEKAAAEASLAAVADE